MTLDPIAAELHGWNVVEQADRLLELAGPQGGEYRAGMRAKAEAMVLADMLAWRPTPEQRVAIRLQMDFWRDVYVEILERAHA